MERLPGVRVGVEWEATGQKIQTSSYKINKFWGSNVSVVIIANNTVLYT